jgi:hypothetical protein
VNTNSTRYWLVIAIALVVANAAAADLVAYWPFDENLTNVQGNAALDGIAIGNVCVATEDTAVGAGSLKIDDDENSVNYVDIPHSVLVNGVPGANTIVAWYKYTDISGNGSDTRNFVYETDVTWSLSFGIRSDTSDGRKHAQWSYCTTAASPYNPENSGPRVDDGQWHHLAMVFSKTPGRIRYYHDGELWDETAINSAELLKTPKGFHIGNHRAGDGTRNWDGYIDDVAIFNAELSASDIAALYNKTVTPATVGQTPEPTGDDLLPFRQGSWTIVVVPDTQYYVSNPANTFLFQRQMTWITDNKDLRNIRLVLFEGDITDDNSDFQWERAKNCISILDGNVPYVLTAGNHDYWVWGGQLTRFTRLNGYFRSNDNPLNDQNEGGIFRGSYEPNSLENAYYEFTGPDEQKLLIIALEFGPRQRIVNWANTIVGRSEYADHTVILLTHAFTYRGGPRYDWWIWGSLQEGNPHCYWGISYDTNDGQELWNELVKLNDNIRFVFSGHCTKPSVRPSDFAASDLTTFNNYGHEVYQMLFNAQQITNGGNGWLRLIEFKTGAPVQVKTYSPALDAWRIDADNHFVIHGTEPSRADFNTDGYVNLRDFAVLGSAWMADANDPSWNEVCDLSDTNDGVIDEMDLAAFAEEYSYAAHAP